MVPLVRETDLIETYYYDEVKRYFDDSLCGNIQKEGGYKKTAGPEQGGTAIREYYTTEDTDWFSEKKKWKGLMAKTGEKKL